MCVCECLPPSSLLPSPQPLSTPPLSPGGPMEPALIAHVHGLALGVSSLLLAASRLPLGAPTGLWQQALVLATRLAQHPYSKTARSKWVLDRKAETDADTLNRHSLSHTYAYTGHQQTSSSACTHTHTHTHTHTSAGRWSERPGTWSWGPSVRGGSPRALPWPGGSVRSSV